MAQGTFGGVVSVDQAWQSVSLEERLELISRAQASGVLSVLASIMVIGSIAYGLDEIWLLAVGGCTSFFVYPLFSSYTWRREKPTLILAYLAVRAVARRYAYGYNMPDLDIIMIHRGKMREIFGSAEQEEEYRQQQVVDFNADNNYSKQVWIILMRGCLVILSEKFGGAKLEFISPIDHETILVKAPALVNQDEKNGLQIKGSQVARSRSIILSSPYPAAQYVFERRVLALIEERKQAYETLESLRKTYAAQAK